MKYGTPWGVSHNIMKSVEWNLANSITGRKDWMPLWLLENFAVCTGKEQLMTALQESCSGYSNLWTLTLEISKKPNFGHPSTSYDETLHLAGEDNPVPVLGTCQPNSALLKAESLGHLDKLRFSTRQPWFINHDLTIKQMQKSVDGWCVADCRQSYIKKGFSATSSLEIKRASSWGTPTLVPNDSSQAMLQRWLFNDASLRRGCFASDGTLRVPYIGSWFHVVALWMGTCTLNSCMMFCALNTLTF